MADGSDILSAWLLRTEQVDDLDGSSVVWRAWLFGLTPVSGTGSLTVAAPAVSGSGAVTIEGTGAITIDAPTISGSDAAPAETWTGGWYAPRRAAPVAPRPVRPQPVQRPSIVGAGAVRVSGPSISGTGFINDDDLVLELAA